MRLMAVAVLALGTSVQGQSFVGPDAFGWTRADVGATYYHWDDFSTVTGPNEPDIAAMPATVEGVVPELRETTGMAFVTTTGNIYSFTDLIEFEAIVPVLSVDGGMTTVLLQVSTAGTELDPESVLIGDEAPVEVVELYRFYLGDGQFGGFVVETLYRFEVPSANPVVVTFGALEPSLSIEAVSVDTISAEAECPADVNRDGSVTPTDFGAWLNAFNNGDPRADQNGDGMVTPTDFGAWLSNFNAGC